MLDWISKVLETVAETTDPVDSETRLLLDESLRECEALYRSAARLAVSECPGRIKGDHRKFEKLMVDLHRGLLIKILVEIANSDRQWCAAEREVARVILRHAWRVDIATPKLAQTLRNVADQAETLKWEALVEPFAEMPPLHDQIPELTALALRIAGLVAKANRQIHPAELEALRNIEQQLEEALDRLRRKASADATKQSKSAPKKPRKTGHPLQAIAVVEEDKDRRAEEDSAVEGQAPLTDEQRQERFDDAMAELDQLIGLSSVKKDIRQLVDFIKIRTEREKHNLATGPISLHAVFEGNPGTGKTTVARILGRLFCGLNLLEQGHTIETDRSGLVAEYAGQTGPQTHKRIDEAMNGVLFIDEAYSLISDQGQDAFGVEAVQALLKRMEDDRDCLIVIIAGYPEPMRQLLRSNPGLSSRFQRTFAFPDYSAMDLLRIFHRICRKSHYRLTRASKEKLLSGFKREVERKDEHFGNGRLARNLFEKAIRRQASRLVKVAPLTRKLLTTLEAEDIDFGHAAK